VQLDVSAAISTRRVITLCVGGTPWRSCVGAVCVVAVRMHVHRACAQGGPIQVSACSQFKQAFGSFSLRRLDCVRIDPELSLLSDRLQRNAQEVPRGSE